jgi:hypothetical protein
LLKFGMTMMVGGRFYLYRSSTHDKFSSIARGTNPIFSLF